MPVEQALGNGANPTADFIRRRGAEIVEAWKREVRASPRLRELSTPALIDHIPQLLAHIGELADRGAFGHPDELPRDEAEKHAFARLD